MDLKRKIDPVMRAGGVREAQITGSADEHLADDWKVLRRLSSHVLPQGAALSGVKSFNWTRLSGVKKV
jgi:hypothetical protein